VVFGGLGLSTIATLVIVPPLLAIALRTGLAETAVNPAVIDPSATANADK
jgi:hypothetical protein